MNFVDIIKKSVISEFSGTISVDKILLSLLLAFIIGVFIIYIYKKTYSGVVYLKSFSLCIILVTMVTSMIIRTISSNLALSLGMVGALSIVRFRTAIKEPTDTAFIFWGITAGIMTGAGLYLVAIIASLGIGIFYFLGYMFGFKMGKQYLLIIRCKNEAETNVNNLLLGIKKISLKTKSMYQDFVELAYEIEIKNNDTQFLTNIKSTNGVISVNLVSYKNDFGN